MTLSILQWNIWYREGIRNIAKFLKAHPTDVVCLQELTIQGIPEIGHTPDYIAKELGYNHYYKQIDLGEGKIDIANGIFSKHPIVSTRFVWINEPQANGVGYDDEYRAYVEAVLDVNGKKITIGTVHMSYTDNGFATTPRKEQEADKLVAALQTNVNNFIFTGDLNATPDSPTIQKVSSVLENVGPDLAQKTWTTKPFSYNGFEEDKLNWRLDYIFASSDIKAVDAKILQTEYSDHLPVWAEVEV
ncbi:MAG TPA: endonuclease/exonuclease/phosphatase family protein [Candidatus Saccharimonadales bacterium]|nr:endonuclease/exonuclease/phosphatase family protein [Candidatus Saccharimonadales bacterium]